jgi:propanol-preferring alcohol dehydrogenase
VTSLYRGSRSEPAEVLDLASAGSAEVHVETYTLDEAPPAYARLHHGKINGRVAILPNG